MHTSILVYIYIRGVFRNLQRGGGDKVVFFKYFSYEGLYSPPGYDVLFFNRPAYSYSKYNTETSILFTFLAVHRPI